MIGGKICQGAGAVCLRGPYDLEGCYEFKCPPNFTSVASVLNQLHHNESRDGREFSQPGEPSQGGGVAALDINDHIGVYQIHWLAR